MQRSLFGLLLVTLFGAVLGAALSWPRSATDPTSPGTTLYEFQTRARAARVQDRGDQPTLALAVQPETISSAQSPAAELPAPAIGEVERRANILAQMASLVSDKPPEAPAPDGPAPARIAAAETGQAPDKAPPVASMQMQASKDSGTEPAHQTLAASRHVKQISIHYRADARSRADAQQVLGQLGSADTSKVDMRTTTHAAASPEVRYFSQQDAAAASAVAKTLDSKLMLWRVKDCTTYRHKPPPGTIQIWLASAGTTPHQPTRRASR